MKKSTSNSGSADKRPLSPADFELIAGNKTILIALVYAFVVGLAILGLLYHLAGAAWFGSYYVPCLGYYVVCSIMMSHYFRSPVLPYKVGAYKHLVAIGVGIGQFYLNGFIFQTVLGLSSPAQLLPGHFLLIVVSFFMFGFDDSYFVGGLSAWCKKDPLKALFWYLVIWILWFGFFFVLTSGAPIGARVWEMAWLNWLLASFQWVIMSELAIAIHWKEYMAMVKYGSRITRGLWCTVISFPVGFLIAALLFCVSYVFFYDAHHFDESSLWHHVLYMGTFPLIPLISLGLYTNNFRDRPHWSPLRIAWTRMAAIALFIIIGYFFFHLAVAPTLVLGEHDWAHHQDLVYNFTVSIVMITQHWFMSRWGFLRLKRKVFTVIPVASLGDGKAHLEVEDLDAADSSPDEARVGKNNAGHGHGQVKMGHQPGATSTTDLRDVPMIQVIDKSTGRPATGKRG